MSTRIDCRVPTASTTGAAARIYTAWCVHHQRQGHQVTHTDCMVCDPSPTEVAGHACIPVADGVDRTRDVIHGLHPVQVVLGVAQANFVVQRPAAPDCCHCAEGPTRADVQYYVVRSFEDEIVDIVYSSPVCARARRRARHMPVCQWAT